MHPHAINLPTVAKVTGDLLDTTIHMCIPLWHSSSSIHFSDVQTKVYSYDEPLITLGDFKYGVEAGVGVHGTKLSFHFNHHLLSI